LPSRPAVGDGPLLNDKKLTVPLTRLPSVGGEPPFVLPPVEFEFPAAKPDQESLRFITGGTMLNYIRWTEDRLRQEIDKLGDRITFVAQNQDRRSRHAVSYMRQLLKDKQDRLALLRIKESA